MLKRDEGIRLGTTVESLDLALGTFPQWPGCAATDGNASYVTNGAAVFLLRKR